jgi:hypothetical protein
MKANVAAQKAKTVWIQSRGKAIINDALAKYQMTTIRKNSAKRISADLEALLGHKLPVKINDKPESYTIIGVQLMALPYLPVRRCSAITLVASNEKKKLIHVSYWSYTYPITIGVTMNGLDKFMHAQNWVLAQALSSELTASLLAEELGRT